MPARMFNGCQVENCNRPHKARKYCATHYAQFLRDAPITETIRQRFKDWPDICTAAEGCDEPAKTKGLCKMHYARLLRHNDTAYRERAKQRKICSIDGCDKPHYCKNMCALHYRRDRDAKLKYGLDLSIVREMEQKQNNVCAICFKADTRINGISMKQHALSVDHDHTTGKIRGLLCDTCNVGIGMFKDNIDTLQSAIRYLQYHSTNADENLAAAA